MALRLGKHIVSGEIFNTTPYSVHGWVELRGREQPLVLQLTGNCSPDLAGWHFRFEAPPASDASLPAEEDDDGVLEILALQQIGPTGTMTVVRRRRGLPPRRTAPLPLDQREASPPEEAPCLYLEWFSQNGRVVIELLDPILEFVEYQAADGTTHADQAEPNLEPPAQAASAETPLASEDLWDAPTDQVESEEEGKDDPFELFPRDLQLRFDEEARATDWNLQDDGDKPPILREMELMDDLIEHSPGVPLSELFDGPLQCPLPDQLEDAEVEEALKTLLAQLALYGIALEICEHFTPREAYRLLLEQICPEERAYPELRNTQWVQHHSTSDYCQQCQAEMEREFGTWEPGEDDSDPDDEIEF